MTHQATATQTPAPNAPTPTAAPPAVTTSVPEAISASLDGMVFRMPTTQAELRAMRNMRDELSDQLQSAARRRENLAEDLDGTTASLRPGLQARIDLLDKRILQIEQDIATTGALVARSRGQLPSAGRPDRGPFNEDREFNPTVVGVLFTLFVLAPIALSVARLVWRRGSNPPRPVIDQEQNERLRRLEGNVDAIALEIERISEGQRFVTKLLAEKERARLDAGRD
jgi:hypothetical protein